MFKTWSQAPFPRVIVILIGYCLVQLFFYLGDSMMSYVAPLVISESLGSPALMGLIIGSSSLFGLLSDAILGKTAGQKSLKFLLLAALALGPAFPMSLWLGQTWAIFYIVGMMVWGVYFELIHFGNFSFIHKYLGRQNHTLGWGVIETFRALAVATGPLVAGVLISDATVAPALMISSVFFLTGLGMVFIFFTKFSRPEPLIQAHHLDSPGEAEPEGRQQLTILRVLFVKIWPLWLCLFALVAIDATFWTIGPLYSETLKQLHPLGGLVLTFYILPSFFAGLLAMPITRRIGKKGTAFLATLLAGVALVSVQVATQPLGVLAIITLMALCNGLAYPALVAAFEDYVARLKQHSGDMIALERSAVNLAYILGPSAAGVLASLIGYSATFGIVGWVVITIAVICLLVVPHKIHMPQTQLEATVGVSQPE